MSVRSSVPPTMPPSSFGSRRARRAWSTKRRSTGGGGGAFGGSEDVGAAAPAERHLRELIIRELPRRHGRGRFLRGNESRERTHEREKKRSGGRLQHGIAASCEGRGGVFSRTQRRWCASACVARRRVRRAFLHVEARRLDVASVPVLVRPRPESGSRASV
eukprot:30294-Pelagococcus_subviridis.AAC.26